MNNPIVKLAINFAVLLPLAYVTGVVYKYVSTGPKNGKCTFACCAR